MTETTKVESSTPYTNKKHSIWKYRIVIGVLILLILGILGSAGYIGYQGFRQLEDKRKETSDLRSEIDKLNAEKNLSTEDLQKKIDEQSQNIKDLTDENTKLTAELNAAKTRIEQLTPKDIKNLEYKKLIKINEAAGDVWLNPTYVDVNGDGRVDGIFSYRMGGAGGFLNVYVYSYLEGNNLNEVLKAEEYQKGTYTYLNDQNILEIRSQAGTPDDPTVAATKFKWDVGTKKMVKI